MSLPLTFYRGFHSCSILELYILVWNHESIRIICKYFCVWYEIEFRLLFELDAEDQRHEFDFWIELLKLKYRIKGVVSVKKNFWKWEYYTKSTKKMIGDGFAAFLKKVFPPEGAKLETLGWNDPIFDLVIILELYHIWKMFFLNK